MRGVDPKVRVVLSAVLVWLLSVSAAQAGTATVPDPGGDAPWPAVDIVQVTAGYDSKAGMLTAGIWTAAEPALDADYFVDFFERVGATCDPGRDQPRARIGVLRDDMDAFGFKRGGDEAGETLNGETSRAGNRISLAVRDRSLRYRSFQCAQAFVLRPGAEWAAYDESLSMSLPLNSPVTAPAQLRCDRQSAFGAIAESSVARAAVARAGVVSRQEDLFDTYAVGSVLCRDLDRDGLTEMGVLLRCCTVSSASPFLVFRRNADGWKLAFSRARNTVWNARARGKRFVLKLPNYRRSDAHCCPSSFRHYTVDAGKDGSIRMRRGGG